MTFLINPSNRSTYIRGQSPKLKAEGKWCFGVLANRASRTNSVVQFHGMRPQMVATKDIMSNSMEIEGENKL